jgi:hypothetical protein
VTQATESARPDLRSLAASLAPVIRVECEGRLGEITWFKTDWQRGGAATGKSTYTLDSGQQIPVVLKVPVVQRELQWTERLQNGDFTRWRIQHPNGDSLPVVPRLFACGETLGGYDLAWIVVEHFPHGPLGLHWHENHVPRMTAAAAQFHAATANYPVDQVPTSEPWRDMLEEAAHSIKINTLPHEQRWIAALRTLRHRAATYIKQWNGRSEDQWLHGDLHLANAMSRTSETEGPVCLIDMAEVHAGHWVEDAIYLERQLWARPERLKVHKPVKSLALARKSLGLPVDSDYPRLAMIRRALLAGTAPKFIKSEGHPAYLEACLGWLEIALNELK